MAKRWTVYGTDSTGRSTSATVEADTEQEAIRLAGERNGIQSAGAYATAAADAGGTPGTTTTTTVTPPPMTATPARPTTTTSTPASASRTAARGANDLVSSLMTPVGIMAGIALLLSVIAFIVALTKGGGGYPGEGMDEYDWDTPREAVESMLEIEAKGDLLAQVELDRNKPENRKERDRLEKARQDDDFEIRDPLPLDNEDIVAVRYILPVGGIKRYRVAWLRKDDNTGDWLPYSPKTSDLEGETGREVQEIVRKWEARRDTGEDEEGGDEDEGGGEAKTKAKNKNPLEKD